MVSGRFPIKSARKVSQTHDWMPIDTLFRETLADQHIEHCIPGPKNCKQAIK